MDTVPKHMITESPHHSLYLPEALERMDTDKDGIVSFKEWKNYFAPYHGDKLIRKIEETISPLIQLIFKIDHPLMVGQISSSVVLNHSDKAGRPHIDNLYNYVQALLPPMVYAKARNAGDNKKSFFFYDGRIRREAFYTYFTQEGACSYAHLFYLWVAWHIQPVYADKLLSLFIKQNSKMLDKNQHGFNADAVFECLKDGSDTLSIDGLYEWAENHGESLSFVSHFSLFGYQHDIVENIKKKQGFSEDDIQNLMGFLCPSYARTGLYMLFEGLNIQKNHVDKAWIALKEAGLLSNPSNIIQEIKPYKPNCVDREEFIDFLALHGASIY